MVKLSRVIERGCGMINVENLNYQQHLLGVGALQAGNGGEYVNKEALTGTLITIYFGSLAEQSKIIFQM